MDHGANRRGTVSAVILALAGALSGCSGKLSTSEVERVIAAYPGVSDVGPVKVDAVSQGDGSNEAFVQVALGEVRLNAKLRRYDKGWQWEFVGTKAGTWLSPEVPLNEMREGQRMKRALAWANERASQYEATIAAVDGYSEFMPRLTSQPFDVLEWTSNRKFMAKTLRLVAPSPERSKILESYGKPAIDAWGNEVLLNFDSSSRTATFVSTGPDGQNGTPDDVLCLVVGTKKWDDFITKSCGTTSSSGGYLKGSMKLLATP